MARRWKLVSVTPVGTPKLWMSDPRTGRQVPDPSAGVTEWASAVIETDLNIGRPMAAGAYRKLYVGDQLPEGSITDLTTSGVTLIPPDEGPEFTVPVGEGETWVGKPSEPEPYFTASDVQYVDPDFDPDFEAMVASALARLKIRQRIEEMKEIAFLESMSGTKARIRSALHATMFPQEAEDAGEAWAEGEISQEEFEGDTGLPPREPGERLVQHMDDDGNIVSEYIPIGDALDTSFFRPMPTFRPRPMPDLEEK
jgi:hypothetical protein